MEKKKQEPTHNMESLKFIALPARTTINMGISPIGFRILMRSVRRKGLREGFPPSFRGKGFGLGVFSWMDWSSSLEVEYPGICENYRWRRSYLDKRNGISLLFSNFVTFPPFSPSTGKASQPSSHPKPSRLQLPLPYQAS